MILVDMLGEQKGGPLAQQVTDDFMAILRKNFKRITSALNYVPRRKIIYQIYPDQSSLLAYHPNPTISSAASKRIIGNFREIDVIRLVSPLNPGPVYDYKYIIRSSLALYAISLTKQINPHTPLWLLFGIGEYIGLSVPRNRVQHRLKLKYSQEIPSVKDLVPYGANKDLCYTIVDFIVTRYSWDALHRFIRDPANNESIFLCKIEQLEEAWKRFVQEQFVRSGCE